MVSFISDLLTLNLFGVKSLLAILVSFFIMFLITRDTSRFGSLFLIVLVFVNAIFGLYVGLVFYLIAGIIFVTSIFGNELFGSVLKTKAGKRIENTKVVRFLKKGQKSELKEKIRDLQYLVRNRKNDKLFKK